MGQAKSAPSTVEEMYQPAPHVFTPLVHRKETLAMHENVARNISQKAAQRVPPRLPMSARPIVANPARNKIMTNVKTKLQNQRKINAASIIKKAQGMNRNAIQGVLQQEPTKIVPQVLPPNAVQQGIVTQRKNNSRNSLREIRRNRPPPPTRAAPIVPLLPPRPTTNPMNAQRTTQNNGQTTTGGRRKTRRHKK